MAIAKLSINLIIIKFTFKYQAQLSNLTRAALNFRVLNWILELELEIVGR